MASPTWFWLSIAVLAWGRSWFSLRTPGVPARGDGSNYRLSALVHVNVFDYHALLFGGFLGIGDDHYPMPWQSLKYNTSLGGYRTNLTADRLKGEP